MSTKNQVTLIDIKNSVLGHLVSSPTFNLEDDVQAIKVDEQESGSDMANHLTDIVRYVLDDLTTRGVVAKVSPILYVLHQPLNQLPQTIVISPITAMTVADLVNGFTKASGEMKETGYVVNKLGVTDRDIAALCSICHMLSVEDEDDDDLFVPPTGRI